MMVTMEQTLLHHPQYKLKFELFYNTPVLDRWKKLSNVKKIFILLTLTWLPLLILSLIEGTIWGPSRQSIIKDAVVWFRYLVGMPLMLITPTFTGVRLKAIVDHFTRSKIIRNSDLGKFSLLVKSTLRLRDSLTAKTLIWILIYLISFLILKNILPLQSPSWQTFDSASGRSITLTGWWYILITQPIYFFFVFYFLYRGFLWWRFMFRVSKFDLQLRASHGDDMGGLAFLAETLKAFSVPALAFSVSAASGAANFVLYEGLDLQGIQHVMIFLTSFLLIFFVGPLLFFITPMIEAKSKGILKYGVLEGHQLEMFEKRWLNEVSKDPELLNSNDFSSVTDASSIVSRVTNMRIPPFTLKDVISLAILILLPFLPVLALRVPWSLILKNIVKLIL